MDLIVRLLGEAASYTATMRNAAGDASKHDLALETLTRTMQRQQVASQLSAREAQVLTIADRGASVAAAEHALSVARELDSLDALAAAETRAAAETKARAAAAKAAADRQTADAQRMVQGLQSERIALTEGTTAAKIYGIEQSNLSNKNKEVLIALTLRNEAVAKQAAEDKRAAAAAAENSAWVQRAIQQSHEAARGYQTSSIYLRLQEAAQRGATDAQISEIYAAIQVEQRNNQVTEAVKRRTAALQQTTQATGAHTSGSRTNMLAIQALAFGLQDAAQVYGTTGLAGAISASANNLIFMTSMLSPHLAIVTAVAVAVGQFATVLGPAVLGIKNQKKAVDDLIASQEQQLEMQDKINQQIREGTRALQAANDYQSAKSEVKSREASLRDMQFEEQQIREGIEAQRRARDARKAIRDEEQRQLTLAGQVGTAVGVVPETVSQREIEEYNKRIYEQQMRIYELNQRQRIAEEQLVKARQQAAKLDEEERARKGRIEATETLSKQGEAEAKARDERRKKADQERKELTEERAKALAEVQKFTPQAQASKADQRRAELANTLQTRLAQLEQWRRAQILSHAEVQAAKLTAHRAYLSARQQLEQSVKASAAKKAAAKAKADEQQRKSSRKSTQTLKGVETGSADGFKAVFDATNGGQGGTEALLVQQKQGNKMLATLVRVSESHTEYLKNARVIRVK